MQYQKPFLMPISMLSVQAKAHLYLRGSVRLMIMLNHLVPVKFGKFTKRYNFHNIKVNGEAASADTVAVTQSANPQEIYCFTLQFYVRFVRLYSGK